MGAAPAAALNTRDRMLAAQAITDLGLDPWCAGEVAFLKARHPPQAFCELWLTPLMVWSYP